MRTAILALALTSSLAAANPTQYARAGEFRGKRILFVNYFTEDYSRNVPPKLEELGFRVDVRVTKDHLPNLDAYDQLWMVSDCYGGGRFDESDIRRIAEFVKRGKGFYNLMDNVPCIQEGARVAKALHGLEVKGDYYGDKPVHVVRPGEVKRMVEEAMKKEDMDTLLKLRRAGYLNGKLYAEDHELLTGIERIYEGITLCHLSESPEIEVILRASDNQPLVGISRRGRENVIHDCGYTRLANRWSEFEPISARWYQNVAAYLQGKRRADLPQ
ncbi:MAG: hypothetical protein HYZ28_10100 [Myxococcales bacterium]|nr:hypothetical protein [Myxococcales bacterium]